MNTYDVISDYWKNGERYDGYIQDEFASFRPKVWTELILSHFPAGEKLNILDVGTGPGFFACILSRAGHEVTGIDLSEGMLACARKNAVAWEVEPDFCIMGAHAPEFPDDVFDLVISRNVTWTLKAPKEAYAQWKRVLKPGGKVLIYDANWHMEFYDEEIRRQVRENERAYFEKYHKEFRVCSPDNGYYDTLPLSNTFRPDWDVKALQGLGYKPVCTKLDVGQYVYGQWEKDLYSASPLFEIEAVKPE